MNFSLGISELLARNKIKNFVFSRYFTSNIKGYQKKRYKRAEKPLTASQNATKGETPGPVITSPKLRPIMSYAQMYALRKDQAHRSVLIQVPGKFSCNHVYQMSSTFGKVNKMFYDSHVKDYMLVEFDNKESVSNLLSGADHFSNADVPTQTRVLYLINPGLDNKATPTVPVQFDRMKGVKMTDLQNASSVTEQLQMFYQGERLTELGTRLRFFLCTLLEDSLSSLLPHAQVVPFGSSVNGFGKHTSDLDMILDLGKTPAVAKKMGNLKYMTKTPGDNERHFVQRTLGVVGDILKVFLPHVTRVDKILEARVPIIHFFHEGLNVYCDLTLNNLSGIQMSEILYNVGAYSPQIHPLSFILQRWASVNELILSRPGPRFSNFMLKCMIIFFLQSRKPPVLLPLKKFVSNGAASNKPSIMQDIAPFPVSQNKQDLGELLMDFFQFYSSFDFASFGISILHGRTFPKTGDCAMLIENPFDLTHNVTSNVRLKELDYLQACLRTAVTKLEQNWEKTGSPWGIMSLIDQQTLRNDVSVGFRVNDLYPNT